PQARAVEARVHERPNAGETDGAAEMPADHGETRGATIHLVDLIEQREAPDATCLLDEPSVFRREGTRWLAGRLHRRHRHGDPLRPMYVELIDADALPPAELGR